MCLYDCFYNYGCCRGCCDKFRGSCNIAFYFFGSLDVRLSTITLPAVTVAVTVIAAVTDMAVVTAKAAVTTIAAVAARAMG